MLSQCALWVRKEGAVCIATSYTQAAQLLYPPKTAGKGKLGLHPCGSHLHRQPEGRALVLSGLHIHLRKGREGISRIQIEERQVLVRAILHGSGESRGERKLCGVSGS